ncbi:Hint domain-containing protein [Shimia sp. MMG029]|uniref:Hint domain-containing protein n=1 Tax=Shimia sp. MMG029 TaxID=3021978 RepID=UPI0022FF1111|nr:Hint domain-containing protein [Shimia sp. MMG029]MDA5558896.1 Hint domain-containing protein [Shimia sp. MMG029]
MAGYISEFQYYGLANKEFIEVAVPTGTDVSAYSVVLYQNNGTVVKSYGLGASQGTFGGKDVYVIDSNTSGFSTMYGTGEMYIDDALALVDDSGTVMQFVSYWGNTVTATEGPAAGMTSTDVGTASSYGSSLQSDDGGKTYYTQYDTNKGSIPACYAPGSRIRTPGGVTLVEDLRAGDLIMTLNKGSQPVRWVWSGEQPLDDVELHQKPVLISKGALATGVPDRDLIVSGQHRVAVGICGQLESRFATPAFVPAKSLVGLPGVRHMAGKKSVRWHHFLCDAHHVAFANGIATESLLLGSQIWANLDAEAHAELALALGAGASDGAHQLPALPLLTKRQAQAAMAVQRAKRAHFPVV